MQEAECYELASSGQRPGVDGLETTGGDDAGQVDLASASSPAVSTVVSADGAWDPSNPNDYYLVTSASMTKHSWLWKLSFVHAAKPDLGGAITKVLEGPADDSPASNRSRRRRMDS